MAVAGLDEKHRKERDGRLVAEIEKRHGKSVEQLYHEREKRLKDAIELREPDRVPITIQTSVFAARYAGLTASAMYYDHAAYREACLKALLEFEPDTSQTAAGSSGLVMELLDDRHYRWPGGALAPDAPFQFIKGEYMKPDEYDIFLKDPSDFMLRYWFPRIYGTLAPLSKLPSLGTVREQGFITFVSLFAKPEFREFAANIYRY